MRLPLYAEDEIGDTLVDLLTILLLVFLLFIVNLIFSVLRVEFASKINTFSGGMTRPYFLIEPVHFPDKDIIYIYKHGEGGLRSDDSLFGLTASDFAGMLGFIDYGSIVMENKRYPIFKITMSEERRQIINPIIIDEEGVTGEIDRTILTDILKEVWPRYNIEELPESLSGSFKIDRRPQIYYESLEDNDRKMIVIGTIIIDVTDGISSYYKFLFDTLATEMMDFVYLGSFDAAERISFLKTYGNEEMETYHKEWRDNRADIIPPFSKYNILRTEYIKSRVSRNAKPPIWVKGLFLDRIGAKLKIIGSKNGNIEAKVMSR